jgi:CHAT domain-containing protein
MVVTQTQGIGILEACLERVESQFNSVLCVGSPHRPDWDDLPEAHAEVVTITGRFREVGKHAVLLAEAEATVTNLKAEAGQHEVLHFACHAMTVTAPSESSRLILAPI